jgi:hypothetical protein
MILFQDLRVEVEQLQSFRTLIEESYQLVSIQSVSPESKFLYANSVWFRALNYIPQDLIGVSILDVCFEDDRDALNAAINQFITVDGGIIQFGWHSLFYRSHSPVLSQIRAPINRSIGESSVENRRKMELWYSNMYLLFLPLLSSARTHVRYFALVTYCAQHCVSVSSSMSINQQGLVIFSMIRDDTSIALAPRSPPTGSLLVDRTSTDPSAGDGAAANQEPFLRPDFKTQSV